MLRKLMRHVWPETFAKRVVVSIWAVLQIWASIAAFQIFLIPDFETKTGVKIEFLGFASPAMIHLLNVPSIVLMFVVVFQKSVTFPDFMKSLFSTVPFLSYGIVVLPVCLNWIVNCALLTWTLKKISAKQATYRT